MDRWPKVAIIALSWNGWRDTIECLESLARITYPNAYVVLLDNGSSDESLPRLQQWLNRWSICQNTSSVNTTLGRLEVLQYLSNASTAIRSWLLLSLPQNVGFAKACNLGMRLSFQIHGANHCLLLNNDTVVTPDFLEPLVKIATRCPEVGCVTGKILYYGTSHIWYAGGHISRFTLKPVHIRNQRKERLPQSVERCVSFASGCMMLLPKRTLLKVGYLDERFFAGGEDVEFCLRLTRQGYRMVYVPESVIYHKVSRSSPRGSAFTYYRGYGALALLGKTVHREPLRTVYLLALKAYTLFILPLKVLWRRYPTLADRVRVIAAARAGIHDALNQDYLDWGSGKRWL